MADAVGAFADGPISDGTGRWPRKGLLSDLLSGARLAVLWMSQTSNVPELLFLHY